MRFALLGLLIACGGSPKNTAPPPPPTETTQAPPPAAPPPVDQPTTVATNVPAPPPPDDQTRAPSMTGDPCEGGQVTGVPDNANRGPDGKYHVGKPPPPSVSIGQADANGALDKAIIRRYVKRNINKIQYCYEKTLLSKPGLSGTVKVSFTIGADGHVTNSAGSGVDPEVADCVAQVIKDIEFPKPKNGGTVEVNYPFVFSNAKN